MTASCITTSQLITSPRLPFRAAVQRSSWICCLFSVLLGLAAGVSQAEEIRSPEMYLGRAVGADFHLADWSEVSGYYAELADASPCVQLQSAGKTTENRELLYAVISSQENLEKLDEWKQFASWIADPRRCSPEQLTQAITQGKVILFITPSMHSDEPASTEMGMQLAWQLASSDQAPWPQIRENVVVVLLPSLNPDGVDHVVEWYRQNVGTPEEGSGMLKLYQYYTGHDNNRDWFSLSQKESRLLTRMLYHEWFPQVLWDVHQFGSQRERFFVPPYRDPLNPNLDPQIVAGINALGNRAILDMTQNGFSGIATGIAYDNWWNGGNRSVPCRHNIIGLLTESAPVNIASPIFVKPSDLKDPLARSSVQPSNLFIKPWPGGWWRLQDIHRYQLAFGQSIMSSLAREPAYWLRNSADAARNVILAGEQGSPRGWLLPPDQADLGALRRFLDILLLSGVELQQLTVPATVHHKNYPAGTIVIGRDQPYGNFVKDLLELKPFPEGDKPYDVAGWSLGALFGLKIVELRETLPSPLQPCSSVEQGLAAFRADSRIENSPPGTLSLRDSSSWRTLSRQLTEGIPQTFLHSSPGAGLVVPTSEIPHNLDALTQIEMSAMPRIAVYAPWRANMNEGWLRWVLDNTGIPFQTLHNETLRAGDLHEACDVLILPDVPSSTLNNGRSAGLQELPYAGGLDPAGLIALEQFVRRGGKLIACEGSASWLINAWQLPLQDVSSTTASKGFQCTGSVLRAQPVQGPLTADLPAEIPLMFARSHAWKLLEPTKGSGPSGFVSHLDFAPHQLLLSGHIDRPEVIAGESAWASGPLGLGTVHLFSFSPHYRSWSQGTFPLLFRAIFLNR